MATMNLRKQRQMLKRWQDPTYRAKQAALNRANGRKYSGKQPRRPYAPLDNAERGSVR